ncbi:MAG: tetratricopeptide repeat protein [Saprospiraceae bacterium]|nr:tetratricopeptide repeat protein [Saprospiraceae bacterium]
MHPRNAVNYSNLGEGYYMAGRFKEAEIYLLKGIELDTTNPNTYICLGDLYRVTNQFQLSEKHYKNALGINDKRIEARNGLGIILTKTGRLVEAEEEYSKILQLEANNFTAFYGLATICVLRENFDLAFDYLEQSFKNGFKDVDSLLKSPDLEALRQKEGQWKKLMKTYFPDQSTE